MDPKMTETSFEALSAGDRFEIGGQSVRLVKRETNSHDELVLHLEIPEASVKKRSKMMLIVPNGLTCYTF
jgi:hypothetical protein